MRRPGFQLRCFWALVALLGAAGALAQTTTDYDTDDNNLIDISTLAQFNAIRWDLDGDGTSSSGNETAYAAAFPNPATGMGCAATCAGYELKNNLNFDTGGHSGTWSLVDGEATSDPGDAYHNDGAGFAPIGTRAASFNTTLDGNGFTISNLFIKRTGNDVALFTATGTSAVITALGLSGAYVQGRTIVATLVGLHRGRIAAVWTSGAVVGNDAVAGLVGPNLGTVVASYSTASITANAVGIGLVSGHGSSGATRASYSIGHIRAGTAVGFARAGGTIAASYWDTDTSGVDDDTNSTPPEGRTTTQLQQPTAYGTSGLYSTWDNEDVDGDGSSGEATDDDAWDFGTTSQYPALKFGGLDPAVQRAARPPAFGSAAVTAPTGLRTGEQITAFTVTAATGSNVAYSASGLPPGLSFGAGACATALTICGTPTRTGTFAVRVLATNAHGRHALASFDLVVGGIEIDTDPSTDSVADPGPLDLEETPGRPRSAREYTVRLTAAPNAAVTVTIASADTDAVTVDDTSTASGVQDTLTFTTTSWNTAQTVTVRGVADRDGRDESVQITHTASGGGYNGVSAPLTATVDDAETPALVIDADPRRPIWWGPLLALSEDASDAANSKTYSVRLATEPTAAVVVAIANGDATAVTLDRSSLTFTAANWRLPQTVTATALNDSDSADAYSDITHTASGAAEYDGLSPKYALRVTVSDDERTGTDYDTDEDNLIEIASLAQLNAVRWDPDGDGTASAGNATSYGNAFPGASTGMGCRSTCIGYELATHLDFDTDGDGDVDANDTGSYANWVPILELDSGVWFQGNGLTIRHLTINKSGNAGLFDNVNGTIWGVGMPDVNITATGATDTEQGALAANVHSTGKVIASWSSGTIRGPRGGGLVGRSRGRVAASFSTATITGQHPTSPKAGGVVASLSTPTDGRAASGITAKAVALYSSGTVRAHQAGGVIYYSDYGEVRASYFSGTVSHTSLSGSSGQINEQSESDSAWPEVFADNVCAGTGTAYDCTTRTSAQLRAATGPVWPFHNWHNQDIDGDGAWGEAAWDFGTNLQPPALSYPPLAPHFQRGDFDTDDNGLIEVSSLAQLDAIRWDLDGDGTVDSGVSNTNAAKYTAAFSDAVAAGCPDTDDADTNAGPCLGYELASDLDFDTDDDGSTHTSGTSDSGDAYHNSGAGWTPIGTRAAPFNAIFDGGGHVIENLFVNRTTAVTDAGLFSAAGTAATIRSLGLRNVYVASANDSVGALTGRNSGRIAASWATGAVSGRSQVGGLVGTTASGSVVVASYSAASVTITGTSSASGGGLVAENASGASIRASYAIGAVSGGNSQHGLTNNSGTVAASYWDTTGTGVEDDMDAAAPEGRTPAQLRAPTAYGSGLYAAWDDEDVDGDGEVGAAADYDDDAWDFGDIYQYPVLKFGGFDTTVQIRLLNSVPSFDASLSNRTVQNGRAIQAFQLPTVSGGEGDLAYTLSGLPDGLSFDANGTGTCQMARTICGTPSTDGVSTVTVTVADSDRITEASDTDTLSFMITVVTTSARISATSPAALSEGNLNNATATVTLANTTFTSGVGTSSFTLGGTVPGLSVDSVATVSAGDSSATLTLGYNGANFDDHRALSVTVAASAHALAGSLSTAPVNVSPTRGVRLSPSALLVPERDSAMYRAVLASQPTGPVTVAITGAGSGISVNPTSLSFTASNWNRPQTVTVSAADDQNAANEAVTLTHMASGADYGSETATLSVTALDDDRPGLRVIPTNLTVRENSSAAYSVQLNTQPTAEVTVTVGGATAEVTADADPDTPGDQVTLLFDATTWDRARMVTVSAADDDDATDEMVSLTHATDGGNYANLMADARPGVSVSVEDDDEPALVLDADPSTPGVIDPGPLTLNELSGHADREKGYTVRLATEPTGSVTVDVSSGDRAVHVDAAPTPRMRTLTFTTTNWSMPQTVTATAAEDDDASDEEVAISHSASGSDYAGVSVDLRAETTDDDTPALVVDAASLTGSGLAEGASATYRVRLDTEPTGRVLVSASAEGGVSVDADGGQSGLQPTLWFDAADWSVPQTVTVRARRDDDGASATVTLRHSASGADYGGVTAAPVSFAVTDADAPAVRVSALTLSVNEGSAALYQVSLATRPFGGAVTVALSSSSALATVSPTMLVFTASDWNAPRRVTVQGTTDGTAMLSHTVSGADYGSVSPPTVAVTVRDTNAAGVRLEPPQLLLREGDSGSYGVRLNTAPAGTVTVTTSAAAGLSLVGGGTLLFTASDWSVEQTVSVTAADDDDPNDGTLTVTHGVSGYAGVTSAPTLDVLVSDDDVPGFVFAPGGLSLSEGGGAASSATYQVRLATPPTGQVAVTASSDDAGLLLDTDGTPRTRTLTFTTTNWSSGQTVSVRAVVDGDRVSEMAVLLHEGSGGGYDGASGLLRVRVKDSEARPPRPEPPSSIVPPEVAGLFEDLELGPGESVLVDLSGKFFDDGPLRHAAESSDPSVATAVVSGSGLRVAGLSPGVATVTVTATDLDGLSVSQSFRVSVGRMASFASAWAAAPEGGILRLGLTLSRPAPSSGLRVSWSGGPDGDPSTADADAADLDVLSGTAEFAPGGTEAFIEVSVLDDDDVEPARERLLASLTPPLEGAGWALGDLSEATLEIQEGVCDRTPAVREALRGARECWAPTPLDLSRRGYLGLRGLGFSGLRAGDLQGLSRLRALHLHGNRLQSLPASLFEGLASLERLDLGDNRLESLPPGLFAGVANLSELNLEGNPGAPFVLVMRLARTDAEPWAPGPASVEARVAEGAPFALSAEVLADGAELSSESASVPAGALAGPPLQAEPTGPGVARLSLSGMPQVPQGQCGDVQDGLYPCFRGLVVEAGPPLVLFKPPPGSTDEPPMPTLSANGERASFALDGLFSPSEAEDRLSYEAESDRPDLVSVRIRGDALLLIANEDGTEGTAVVTVTATDPDGQSASLSFSVTVEFAPQRLLRSWRLEWLRGLREAAQ